MGVYTNWLTWVEGLAQNVRATSLRPVSLCLREAWDWENDDAYLCSLIEDILCYAQYLTRDVNAAKDLVQDAFLWIIKNGDLIQIYTNIKYYIFAIVRHLWGRQRRRYSLIRQGFWRQVRLQTGRDDRDDPELQALRAIDAQIIRAAFSTLPLSLQEVLVLREVNGLSYQEISDVLNVPIGTVMSRLYRARRQLRHAVESLIRQRQGTLKYRQSG